MLLRSFPEINMVRNLKNEAARGGTEWRNVVLNFECREASRLHLESPYSIFANIGGHSHCRINKTAYRVETDMFLLSQPGDIYDLTVDNHQKTELCNIHINKRFFDGVAATLQHTHEQLLNDPTSSRQAGIKLNSQLYARNDNINSILQLLRQDSTYDNGIFDDTLILLTEHLLVQHAGIRKDMEKLPFVRVAVREDIYRRLTIARDYIHSNYRHAIDLDAICRETALSRFHFLRLFKMQYGTTPHKYISDLRLKKAIEALRTSQDTISSIASDLGYEYPNSFIKAFRKAYNTSPEKYRRHEISNFG